MEYRRRLPSKYFADRVAQAEAKGNVDVALLDWAEEKGLNVIFNIVNAEKAVGERYLLRSES
jgi:hypothetical protein